MRIMITLNISRTPKKCSHNAESEKRVETPAVDKNMQVWCGYPAGVRVDVRAGANCRLWRCSVSDVFAQRHIIRSVWHLTQEEEAEGPTASLCTLLAEDMLHKTRARGCTREAAFTMVYMPPIYSRGMRVKVYNSTARRSKYQAYTNNNK